MNNKIIIKLIAPQLNMDFDIVIPVNEIMWKVKKIILKSISDILNLNIDLDVECFLINLQTLKKYDSNEIIVNTDIRNGSELILLSQTKV